MDDACENKNRFLFSLLVHHCICDRPIQYIYMATKNGQSNCIQTKRYNFFFFSSSVSEKKLSKEGKKKVVSLKIYTNLDQECEISIEMKTLKSIYKLFAYNSS